MRGDYPRCMRKAAGKKIPKFTWKQSKQLVNSFDFLGVNYYVTTTVEDSPNYEPADQRDFIGDMCASVAGNLVYLKLLLITMLTMLFKTVDC